MTNDTSFTRGIASVNEPLLLASIRSYLIGVSSLLIIKPPHRLYLLPHLLIDLQSHLNHQPLYFQFGQRKEEVGIESHLARQPSLSSPTDELALCRSSPITGTVRSAPKSSSEAPSLSHPLRLSAAIAHSSQSPLSRASSPSLLAAILAIPLFPPS